MTIHELNFKLAMLEVQDPFTRDTYLNPHFAGNYTGTVRSNHFGKGYYLLDSTFDPNASDVVDPGDLLRDLDLEDSKGAIGQTTDVAFYVPSMGIYPVLDIRRKKGDWGDGDGPYDYIELICAEEPDADDLIEGGDDDPINEDVGTVNITFNYGDGDKDYDTGYIVQYADRYEVQSDLNMATGKTLEEMKANFEKEVESNLDYDVEDLFFDWNIEENAGKDLWESLKRIQKSLEESKKKVKEAVGKWHGMSREDIQDFAENSSEYWTGDDSWVEGIVQWLLDCNDEDVWNIVTSDNIDDDDDTFLMDEFMASPYCED